MPPVLIDTNVLIYTFDQNDEDHNQGVLEGVRFVNPFLPDFDVDRWR